MVECRVCGGVGFFTINSPEQNGAGVIEVACPKCNGAGKTKASLLNLFQNGALINFNLAIGWKLNTMDLSESECLYNGCGIYLTEEAIDCRIAIENQKGNRSLHYRKTPILILTNGTEYVALYDNRSDVIIRPLKFD